MIKRIIGSFFKRAWTWFQVFSGPTQALLFVFFLLLGVAIFVSILSELGFITEDQDRVSNRIRSELLRSKNTTKKSFPTTSN